MRTFDYAFLNDGVVGSRVVNLVSSIVRMRWENGYRVGEVRSSVARMESSARARSVWASNAIEGITVPEDRLRHIMSGGAPSGADEAVIAGYRDAFDFIVSGYGDMSLGESTVLRIYGMMTSYSGEESGYKKENNVITETDAEGNISVRFVPVDACDVPDAMEQLILAYYDARDSLRINPLLLIPCFILDFLSIHPFPDGNGRMSRLLALFLLCDAGFDIGRYVSLEDRIYSQRGSYYRALRLSSDKWHGNGNDYGPFIEDFISTVFYCYRDLDRCFASDGSGRSTAVARIGALVRGSPLPLSKKDICLALPDLSVSTVESALGKLVREGKIVKVGANKNARYRKAGRV